MIPSHLQPDERFDVTTAQALDIARGWVQLLADNGLEVLAAEQSVVVDDLKLAGTLDRIVRLTKPLTFDDVTIPAGTVLVLDIKTSKLHADDDGLPSYWDTYPVQIAAYASSVPYVISDDFTEERRATWEEVLP